MRHLVSLFLLSLSLLLGTRSGTDSMPVMAASTVDSAERTVCLTVDDEKNHDQRDRLTDARACEEETSKAVLTDGQAAHRIASSRPQRLLPVYPVKPNRVSARLLMQLTHCRTFQSSPFDGRGRTESAPFQSSASCAYYVFALRRILC